MSYYDFNDSVNDEYPDDDFVDDGYDEDGFPDDTPDEPMVKVTIRQEDGRYALYRGDERVASEPNFAQAIKAADALNSPSEVGTSTEEESVIAGLNAKRYEFNAEDGPDKDLAEVNRQVWHNFNLLRSYNPDAKREDYFPSRTVDVDINPAQASALANNPALMRVFTENTTSREPDSISEATAALVKVVSDLATAKATWEAEHPDPEDEDEDWNEEYDEYDEYDDEYPEYDEGDQVGRHRAAE